MVTKLAEKNIIWLDESQIYVADKELYDNPEKFLRTVFEHIQVMLNTPYGSEFECGWCRMPEWDKYLPRVNTGYMVHRINSEYDWWFEYEPGTGRRKVWMIDFAD